MVIEMRNSKSFREMTKEEQDFRKIEYLPPDIVILWALPTLLIELMRKSRGINRVC
jgi:hypothetical protein